MQQANNLKSLKSFSDQLDDSLSLTEVWNVEETLKLIYRHNLMRLCIVLQKINWIEFYFKINMD